MRKLLLVAAALAIASSPAFGSLLFTLNAPLVTGNPGDELFFAGSLQNTGAADMFLTDLSLTFDAPGAPGLTLDPNVFPNVPGILFTGDPAYLGNIFAIQLAFSSPPGLYTGTATITETETLDGLGNPAAPFTQVSTPFQVTVTPEPGSFALLVTGLLCVVSARLARAVAQE